MIFRKIIIAILVIGAVVNGGFYIFRERYTNYNYAGDNKKTNRPAVTGLPSSLALVSDSETAKKFIIPKPAISKWVQLFFRTYTRQRELTLNNELVKEYLNSIADQVNMPPKEGLLAMASDGKLFMSVPSRPGKKLNIEKTILLLAGQIKDGDNVVPLVMEAVEPNITPEKVSALGISGIIGTGESNFSGSPEARVHNISVGAEKYNGTMITPGEEFSFNKILGPVDENTGYEYELVVKNGKLIKEPGGGICQVSTTFFRAALNSGFKITERHHHSLPVRYYNPQGMDATIYPGSADLKFINDTDGYVLIQTKVEGAKLIVEFFGRPDGRKVAIIGPTQYDVKPDGSLRAFVGQDVTFSDGTIRRDRFYSYYKSPSSFTIVTDPQEVAPRSN